MSGKIVGMVFDHYPGKASELLLAVKLADNAHDDGSRIFPSVGTLAELTRQSPRAVQYQLRNMQAMGWLVLVRQAVGGGRGGAPGRPREYRIHPNWVRMHDSRIPADQRPVWTPLVPDKAPKETSAKVAPISLSQKGGAGPEMSAKVAPIYSGKRVQVETEMGATIVAEMGASIVAPEPSLTVKEPNTPLPPKGEDGFGEFWKAYPKKHGEANARRQWAKLAPDAALRKRIVDAVRVQAATEAWKRDGGQYVPHASKWLAAGRWADVVVGIEVGGVVHDPDSLAGVEQTAVRLGLAKWDRGMEQWPVYRARVRAAERAAAGAGA